MMTRYLFLILSGAILGACKTTPERVEQVTISRISAMPDQPEPFRMLDWYEKAHNFDQYAFNPDLKGEYLPFLWTDNSRRNMPQETFGLYTVIGDVRQGAGGNPEFHEALNSMGAILGAGLVGIDKTRQNGVNYVKMLQNYFNRENGWNIMMNNTNAKVAMMGGGYGRDWWYDVIPNVLYYGVCDLYPGVPQADSLQRIIANQFYKADSVLNGNYDYSYFDYGAMKGMRNHIPYQQDAAAGHAYVLYCAYRKFGDERYLQGAKSSLEALLSQKESRFYEIFMPFGAYVAACLNAEHGTNYDVKKLIDWTFDGCVSDSGRKGWGVIAERWGDYDVHGLQGNIIDGGGYAFLMNSFAMAWPLVPLVKYDSRYAEAMGKWMLNVTNAARLCYPYEIDDAHQWLPDKKEISRNVIAYEGIRKADDYGKESLRSVSPVAIGDGPKWAKGQPEVSMFSLYSSAQVGIFGAIVRKTNIDRILQLNCNATDFYRKNSMPTYLYYNPYDEAKEIRYYNEGSGAQDLYDVLTQERLAENLQHEGTFTIPAKTARLVVAVPAGTELKAAEKNYAMAGALDSNAGKQDQ
jgi:hypothetical protein